MIRDEGILVDARQLLAEISEKLERFHNLLYRASHARNPGNEIPELLAFSPEEWTQIAISIKHYQLNIQELKKATDQESFEEWFYRNGSMLGYLRDMVCSWYDRLPTPNQNKA